MFDIPEISVTLTTLTPIWTGNFNMEMRGVRETGILGSLRWWYEAIMRGFDCAVCDPTSDGKGKCQYNEKQAPKSGIAQDGFQKDGQVCVCPVCQLFGCTGWSKRFRMRWYADQGPRFRLNNAEDTYRHPQNGERKNNGYYICSREKNKNGGTCKAVFYPQDECTGKILTYLLHFAASWGGFGARPQFGYGICKADIQSPYNPELLPPQIYDKPKVPPCDLPDLRDFFFCQFQPNFSPPSRKLQNDPNYWVIETKYRLREALRTDKNISDKARHYICGEVRSNTKNAAKIFISRMYDGQMLIRGYVPTHASVKYDQGKICNLILETLNDHATNDVEDTWVVFDPDEGTYQGWAQDLIGTLAPLPAAKL